MVKKKGKSKRQTLKQKYKIERRVKEHKRKTKKETRRRAKLGLPPAGIGQRKKAATIPNSWPFKDELLEELAQAKRRMEEDKVRQKEEAALRRKQALLGSDVAALIKQAEARGQAFDQQRAAGAAAAGGSAGSAAGADKDLRHLGQASRRAFIRDLREVVETADVILEVLDARDPLGSRAEAVEELILRRPGKKLVLVLNKVDLVPQEVVAQWLAFLRRSHPAVAFKAATQEQRSGLSQHAGDAAKAPQNVLSRSGSVGAEALMQLLKNYCRSLDLKTAITVGIVGYPNVGKSSLINSLKRAKSVGVSSTPGFTKVMQEVQLDKHIKLLDSPGIVFDDDDVDGVLLRNCVSVDTLPDPAAAVQAMLKRCDPADLMMLYALPTFDAGDTHAFLALLARKLGKLLKGGVPDRTAAARVLLRDWNTGKVPFYTKPPAEAAESSVVGEAQLVGALGHEFEVLLQEGDAKVMDFLGQQQQAAAGAAGRGFVAFASGGVAGRSARLSRMLESGGAGGGGDVEMEEEEESGDEEEEEGMEVEEESESEESEESEEESEEEPIVAPPPRVTGRRGKAAAATAAAAVPVPVAKAAKATKAAKAKKPTQKQKRSAVEREEALEAANNPQVNRTRARARKEDQKKARKLTRRAAASSSAMEGDEDFDFQKDFQY